MRIYLVRHGESVGNKQDLMYGHTDYPLTNKGIEDAKKVAEKLKDFDFSICYTSELQRAFHTAEYIVGNREVEVNRLKNLNEQYMGDFENITFKDLMIKYPKEANGMIQNWIENAPVNGETFDELYNRVSTVADMILNTDRDTLVVAHFGSLTALLIRILGVNKEVANKILFEHGTYTEVIINEYGTRLGHLNS
ncbi:histidine phosphatase family protein [Anaeromicropila herbilytica]|uniref:phosphoglycerate mutase (2,3-diphosphoglycerate-dependent) n=1 Tax=Anaeromicropila herbilytica TaxID=2785025 RepID=A0A7R7IE50_9FIRM|nr:histidine phosphatase family protein [Anaeromicropila herbilytica]BCN32257.1 alpha-ribazole phosphatase [Anaeromicropila herbilytica]